MFQPGANLNTVGFGNRPENVEVPHIEARDPSPMDVNYPQGKRWLNTASNEEFILFKFQSVSGVTQAVWSSPVGSTGAVISLSGATGGPVFPDNSGNIALAGTSNQIVTVSNPGSHNVTSSLADPLTVARFVTTGNTSLAGSTNAQVIIGNTAASPQEVSIEAGSNVRIKTAGLTGQLLVGNASNSAQFACDTLFTRQLANQGSLGTPQALFLTDVPIAMVSSFTLTSGSYNTTGSEGIIQCLPSGAVSINLVNTYFPGALIFIYDSLGTANVNNITVNAPAGGNILQAGTPPAASFVINVAYQSLILLRVPNTTPANFLVLHIS